MRDESVTKQIGAAVGDPWAGGSAFFGSVMAGTLVGLGLDWWLDMAPVFVIAGIVLGAYSAFSRLWFDLKNQPDPPAVTLLDERPNDAG